MAYSQSAFPEELYKGRTRSKQTMSPVRNEPRDLLLNSFRVGFGEQIQQHATEIMRVTVRKSQLIGDGIEKQVTTCTSEHPVQRSLIRMQNTRSPSVSRSTAKF